MHLKTRRNKVAALLAAILSLVLFGWFFQYDTKPIPPQTFTLKTSDEIAMQHYVMLDSITNGVALVTLGQGGSQQVKQGDVLDFPQKGYFATRQANGDITGTVKILKVTPTSVTVYTSLNISHSEVFLRFMLTVFMAFLIGSFVFFNVFRGIFNFIYWIYKKSTKKKGLHIV